MAQVFVVVRTAGSYSDQTWEIKRAFLNNESAEQFVLECENNRDLCDKAYNAVQQELRVWDANYYKTIDYNNWKSMLPDEKEKHYMEQQALNKQRKDYQIQLIEKQDYLPEKLKKQMMDDMFSYDYGASFHIEEVELG